MKRYKKIGCVAALAAVALFTNGCKKILDENPQANIVPSFFNSPAGVLGGIAGVYNDIRSAWGTEGFSLETVAGTDEHLAGGSASGLSYYTYNGLNSTSGGGWWNTAYTDINTLNGVLQYGANIDLPDATKKAYLAQAKFLRAFWYFHLAQCFGDVPLNTKFITTPTKSASRQPVADVYVQIIKDLTEAAADLPNTPSDPFLGKAATKPTALYLLAKAYLTRGWLNNTATDFQQAATIASGIIAGKATYGLDLWQDYGDAFVPANDYGRETMFVSDHSNDPKYGQYTVGGAASGGAAQNLTPWFYIWNYPANSGVNSIKNAQGALTNNTVSPLMVRDATNGRPYIRTRPNTVKMAGGPNAGRNYILDQAFVNRVNDSRYDNTFQKVWISNNAITNNAANTNNQRGISYTMQVGVDTAIWMPDTEVAGAPQFDGTRPFKGIIIPPSLWSNQLFPSVRKFMDPSRGANFNDPSTRPVVMYRFSDVYLIAAEAYFKDNKPAEAANMLNVVRQRAAYRKANSAAQNALAAAAMTITAADVTLDFILDERTRENYGEWQRWFDLVRTRSLITRVSAWNNEAGVNIKAFHMLRPIPQTQIDRTVEGPKFPQNPGY
ncbi:RagB/SusD family nutrient uptake outer membrane protein [Sediminibacterium soli]|uniref:RagB/SusD family nutrient uptake outer membrane protein n=1 Tax=Sediminibacterium soli TaxID=2698829 RepID=UPI00137B19EF|nr:RagB/SusD family nutrient uptake outer membrane protein [Sediminibacterium soli]NCI45735.1 RagB/SusD family nutrient uptake outer membrane protein [Sediminibacterium soli]